jgi:hypothetical protein
VLKASAAAIAATFVAAHVLGLGGLSCGLIVRTCYDSGWVAASNQTRSMAFEHGLGRLPSAMTIYFSPNQQGSPAYPIEYRWGDNLPGNPITVSAGRDAITLEIGAGMALRAVWSAQTGQWTQHERGFIRVIAAR